MPRIPITTGPESLEQSFFYRCLPEAIHGNSDA